MAETDAATALSARDVLRIPDFRRLWAAQGISDVGDGLTMLTLMLLVNHLTQSTMALAALAIVLAIPPPTIGFVAGTYADRWDRRRIMLVSDSLRAVAVLGFVLVDSAALLPAGAVVLAGGVLSLVLYRGVAPRREPSTTDDPMTTERAPA